MRILSSFLAAAALCFLMITSTNSVLALDLIKAGQARCAIVVDTDPVEQHAASELSHYLEKITGAVVTVVPEPPPPGLVPIRYQLITKQNLDNVPQAKQLRDDGYLIDASEKQVVIASRKRRGFLYGTYKILRENGVYWFHPGEEGELCPEKTDVTVANGVRVFNPVMSDRHFRLNGGGGFVPQTYDWLLRNGMQVFGAGDNFAKYDSLVFFGGHVLTRLLLGGDNREELLAAQPELFGLKDGKRVICGHDRGVPKSQPCTSNPETVRRMIATAKKMIAAYGERDVIFSLCNDDHRSWCECEECAKLDPPEERARKIVSTRWWTLVNQISAALPPDEYPNLTLNALAYQNFVEVPLGIKPDPRVRVTICGLSRCYFHALTDPHCQRNAGTYLPIYRNWSATGLRATNFEYHTNIQGASRYVPCERAWITDMKFMHELGMCGAGLVTRPPDGNFKPPWDDYRAYHMWYSLWQLHWLAAHFAWHIDDDYETVWNDINEKYYGAAWPIMREYRLAMEQALEDAKVHLFYGGDGGIPLGRAYTKPGVASRLEMLLARAEQIVENDPAQRQRVLRDKTYLEKNWAAEAANFLSTADRRIWVSPSAMPMRMDGQDLEATWQKAPIAYAFYIRDQPEKLAQAQTKVQLLFDDENLYLLIKADPPKNVPIKTTARQDGRALFNDSHIEIFLGNQDMQDKYYMLAFNWEGKIYQARAMDASGNNDFNIQGRPEIGIKITPELMVAEVRLPLAPSLGQKVDFDIPWSINVARREQLSGDEVELSSLCNGAFHGSFLHWPLIFEGITAVPVIGNGGFEEVAPPRRHQIPKYNWEYVNNLAPRGWLFNTTNTGKAEVCKDNPFEGENFLRISGNHTFIEQLLAPPRPDCGEVAVSARVRGKGEVLFRVRGCDRQRYGSKLQEVDSQTWQLYEDVIACPSPERLIMRLHGEIDIDDVRVTAPSQPGKVELFVTPATFTGQFKPEAKISFRVSTVNHEDIPQDSLSLRYRFITTDGAVEQTGQQQIENGQATLEFAPLSQPGYGLLQVELYQNQQLIALVFAGAAQGVVAVKESLGASTAAIVTKKARVALGK